MGDWLGAGVLLACFAAGYWLISTLMSPGANAKNAAPAWDSQYPGDSQFPRPAAPRWFDILEVSQFATRAEIAQAYAAKCATYEPGRRGHLGPEFQAIAAQKLDELTRALQTGLGQQQN
jgi:hypothetical protein